MTLISRDRIRAAVGKCGGWDHSTPVSVPPLHTGPPGIFHPCLRDFCSDTSFFLIFIFWCFFLFFNQDNFSIHFTHQRSHSSQKFSLCLKIMKVFCSFVIYFNLFSCDSKYMQKLIKRTDVSPINLSCFNFIPRLSLRSQKGTEMGRFSLEKLPYRRVSPADFQLLQNSRQVHTESLSKLEF